MALTDNLETKIKKARAAGYSDSQIQSFLSANGVKALTVSKGFFGNVKDAFTRRTDAATSAQLKAIDNKQTPASATLQTLGQGAGFIADVAGEAVKTIPFAEKVIGAVAKPIAGSKPAQDVAAVYQQFKQQHPEAAANLEATGLLASLLPVGAGTTLAGKATLSGAGKAVNAVGRGVSTTGRAAAGTGRVLNNTAFNHSVGEAERVLSYRAQTPFLTRVVDTLGGKPDPKAPRLKGDTARDFGIMGTETMVGVNARRASSKLWSQKIAPAVKASSEVLTKDELFAPAQRLIDETVDPTRKAALQNAFDALAEDYAKVDQWTLDSAQALKRDLAKFTAAKQYRGQDVASEVKTLQFEMANAIRQKTYDALKDVNIKRDYLDYSNLLELENVGVKALSEAPFKGGSGALISGIWDMATTPIKTVGGQVLYRVGKSFEFVGDEGIKRFGDFLLSKGFGKPSRP